jgi:hypothetical protein
MNLELQFDVLYLKFFPQRSNPLKVKSKAILVIDRGDL